MALLALSLVAVPVLQPVSVVYGADNEVSQPSEELEVVKDELEEIEELEVADEGIPYEEQVDSIEEAVEKIETNSRDIYDTNTISARVDLLLLSTKSITIATTELTNKIQKAHVDIGFGITKAVAKAVNPFTSVDELRDAEGELNALLAEVSNYPELTSDDVATGYYKANLSRSIWDTRVARDRNVLGKKTFDTYNELNKAITRAVGVKLNPRATCGDIDQAIQDLAAAYETALINE